MKIDDLRFGLKAMSLLVVLYHRTSTQIGQSKLEFRLFFPPFLHEHFGNALKNLVCKVK